MKTVMVDMDNVLVDTKLLDLINEFLESNYKRETLKNYYLQELVKDRKSNRYVVKDCKKQKLFE